jgi:hypothetical protein
METKRPICCARLVGKVTALKGELNATAHKASMAYSRGRPMERWNQRIEDTKQQIVNAEKTLTDHEADHAGEAR